MWRTTSVLASLSTLLLALVLWWSALPIAVAGAEESAAQPTPLQSPKEAVATEPVTSISGAGSTCLPGTVKDPRSGQCLVECLDGRLQVAAGECCWPGQDLGATTGHCVGVVAYCPKGTIPNPRDPEDCLRLCADGRVEVSSGHCCWPGQAWNGRCEGQPRCPPGTELNPRAPTECARECPGDRLEVAPGHCCRRGEAWAEDRQECVGAAPCVAGTMANPRDVSQCLNICEGTGVEVAPGHCCWPGQIWNIDTEACEAPALACPSSMRLSPQGECLSVEGPCDSGTDCDSGSACLAGRCTPGHSFRRVEVLADGSPVVLGSWSINDNASSSSIVSNGFSQRGGGGFSARASWAVHPRWTVGGYLGYLRMSNGQIDLDQAGQGASWPLRLRMVRTGAIGAYHWPVHRALACGVGIEGGFLVGTTGSGDTPFGAELAPDFFLDIPLSAARRGST